MEHRAYFFTNMYISDIQRGIQTAHCISDMHMKYKFTSDVKIKMLNEWATVDKTMIVLNGGYSAHLKQLLEMFDTDINNEFPYECFYESKEALDCALTCVGIILPDYVYNSAKDWNVLEQNDKDLFINSDKFMYDDKYYDNTKVISYLIQNLSNYRLA